MGPLNEYKQYDYAVVSNWVRYPVFVIARDPERFTQKHMKNVLQFLEDNSLFFLIILFDEDSILFQKSKKNNFFCATL